MAATLTRPKLMTYEQYADLPDDGHRYELIDGVLVMAAAPNGKHLIVSKRYYDSLSRFVESRGLGSVYHAPYEFMYADNGAVQPDIFFISRDRLDIIEIDNMTEPPDLIAEIISPSNRRHDEVTKATIYARLGVKEYWLLDPENEAIHVYALLDGVYHLLPNQDGIARSALLPGFSVDLALIFDWPANFRS